MTTTNRTPWTPGPWAAVNQPAPYSADTSWLIVDGTSDNGDVIAAIDPDDIRGDLDNAAEANAALIALAPEMAESLVDAEAAIGENLVWITDCADLLVRQKDPEALRRLKQLEDAWTALAKIASRIPKGE